jgi:hypothetical protein
MARSAGIPDSAPPTGLDVVIVTVEDQKALARAKKTAAAAGVKVSQATVEQEPGPWNALFLSIPYLVFVYLLFSINVIVILYACFQFAMLLRSGEFIFGLRNIIFLLGIVGSAVYSASLLLRHFAYATKMLEAVATFIISIAFHLLLYLWSVFLMQVRHNKSVYYFRVLVAFGALVVTLAFISTIVTLNVTPNDQTRSLARVLGYMLPVTQIIIALAFLGYAVKFLRRRETVKISKNTYQALTRLGQVAIIAFVAYFAVAATNLDVVTRAMVTPGALATGIILRMLSASIRGLTLLTVLGVRTPKKQTNISSGLSATGTTTSVITSKNADY